METHKANCPCCDKSFSGKTAQRRLNSHCKNNHISYYRQHIRPLKNTKAVNHDAYIRRRDKDPAKVRQARLMSQLKKRARLEQFDSIKQSPRVEEPMLPKEITINPSNPFYVVEFELKIFIGLKRDDLLAFDPIPVLEDAIQGVNPDLHEVHGRLLDALETARQAANEGVLPSLAHTYQFYRHAIQEGDLYEQRMQQFTFQQQKIMNPEKYIDEDLVAKRAAELLAEYKPRKYRRTKTAPTTGGAEDTEGTDGDSELEEDPGMDDLTYAFVEPSRGLTDEIPNSDRESSIEL